MSGRVKRRAAQAAGEARAAAAAGHVACALCDRPIGQKVEWHHRVPKSEGGRETVPVHPICHRTIHACASNADLAGPLADLDALRGVPAVARFVRWIATKPPDFHAPTRAGRQRSLR